MSVRLPLITGRIGLGQGPIVLYPSLLCLGMLFVSGQSLSASKGTLWDRSFDLRYRLVDEGKYRPALAVGLQDFIGTGVYSGEYLVASKTLTPALTVTGGIGWGRYGSHNGFANPLGGLSSGFNTRTTNFTRTGGVLRGDRLAGNAQADAQSGILV